MSNNIVDLEKVMRVLQNYHATEIIAQDPKMFKYLDKKATLREGFIDGYSFAIRDVMIALKALALHVPKNVRVHHYPRVCADTFTIKEGDYKCEFEITRNSDGTAWGVYPNKPNSPDMVYQNAMRNILILASQGYLSLEDFPRTEVPKKVEKTDGTS